MTLLQGGMPPANIPPVVRRMFEEAGVADAMPWPEAPAEAPDSFESPLGPAFEWPSDDNGEHTNM